MDIEDDILQAAKELGQREGRTAGQILSRLARRGLAWTTVSGQAVGATRGGVPVLPSRGEVVTLARVQALMDQEGI